MILPIEIKYLNTTKNTEATAVAMVAVELPLTRHLSVKTTKINWTLNIMTVLSAYKNYEKKTLDQTTFENAVQFY